MLGLVGSTLKVDCQYSRICVQRKLMNCMKTLSQISRYLNPGLRLDQRLIPQPANSCRNRNIVLTDRQCFHEDFIVKLAALRDGVLGTIILQPYNLPSFKSKLNKLDLIPLSSYPSFFLPLLGFCIGHHGLSSTELTKKKKR